MKLGNRSKTILTGGLVFVVIVLLLGLAEGTVRLRQWTKYGSFGHLSTFYTMNAENNLRVLVANTEERTIKINSLGFRGPEIRNPKPDNYLRIAFLGASTTFCAEVSNNDLAWPHLVAKHVQDFYPGITVDYVNGAVPGYTVGSSLRNLREIVAPLEPDVIVIYHATNDLSVETRKLANKQGIMREGEIEQVSWLGNYSLLWYLAEKNLYLQRLKNKARQEEARLQFEPENLGTAFREDLTALVHEARKTVELVALATFSHQLRAEQSQERQIEAAVSTLYYMPFMTPRNLIAAFDQYNKIIREVGNEAGVLIIDGEKGIPGDGLHFNDTVHFKDLGSRVMAKRISHALLESPIFRELVNDKQPGP